MRSIKSLTPLILALTLSLTGCLAAQLPHVISESQVSPYTLKGTVDFGTRKLQATIGEVANAATVSLIDATSGNTVGSSVTNASGGFVLTFSNFTPTSGTPYILEAMKGLAVGGSSNRAGASAARLRTLLYWNNGWQSLTNSTPGTGIMVSSGTTALAILTSLKKGAGINLDLSKLVNTVSGSTFTEAGTGLSNTNDFQPVLGLVSNAISLDQDPVGAIALNHLNNTYALATGVPVISSVTPSIGTPGGTVTLKGAYLDALNGRNSFWFGTIPASTWSVSTDRTTATVTIPVGAYSAPFTLQQPNGVVQTLSPFYKLHGTVGTLAGNGAASFGDGTGINAQLNSPRGIVLGSSGNLYVAQNDHRIRKITPSGGVTTFAGSGATGSLNATGIAATFNWPAGLTMDVDGNLYVSDYYNNAIRKISPEAVVTTFAGSTAGASGSLDGLGTTATFNNPMELAIDSSGNLYVADSSNHKIRKITPAGMVSTFAGMGTAGSTEGATSSAQFNQPWDVCVDTEGSIFVSDRMNHRIRKIALAGQVSTFAGSGVAGFVDGTGTSAQFNYPSGMKIDTAGNLYVTDSWNNRIRKISPAGVVTTIVGTGVGNFAEGATTSAQLNMPLDLVVDSDGSLIVADYLNHRIRVFTP